MKGIINLLNLIEAKLLQDLLPLNMFVKTIKNPDTNIKRGILKLYIIRYTRRSFP